MLIKPSAISSLKELIASYDAFIFDIYGVLHHGSALFPHTLETLQLLERQQKNVFFISNAPQPGAHLQQRLKHMGLGLQLYQGLITAGDETLRHYKERRDPWHHMLGVNPFVIWDQDAMLPSDITGVHPVTKLEDADFLWLYSCEATKREEDYHPLLDQAFDLGLKAVCSNPDVYVSHDGTLQIRPGLLARYYEARGGEVFYHGKPYPGIYQALFTQIGTRFSKDKILFVGDSLQCDARGAQTCGVDFLLIPSLVTYAELNLSAQENPLQVDALFERMAARGYQARYVMKELC